MDNIDEINEIGFIEILPDENNRFVLMTKKQKDWLISEIEQLKKAKEWISIDDRLPKHESNCDIYSINGYRYTDVLYVDYLNSKKHFFHEESDRIIYMEEVTHWMPLPDLPQ